ncbi:MAG: hypothetical protein KDM81_13180, partial [Verrucomicrobiae bacterium]|nr:hypothetical protein [Verrucomicrobiae bacterium]
MSHSHIPDTPHAPRRFARPTGLALGLLLVATAPAATDQPVPTRSVVFKQVGDVTLRLNVFEPAGLEATDRRPAIVLFFGGGWVGGTPSQFYP